jgi:4,5-dihydroxyphthalate decarboxylase
LSCVFARTADAGLPGPISLDADAPFVAIPAFVFRSFRHNGIYVPAGSTVTEPSGLAVGAVRYRTGGQHAPGRVAKLAHEPPPGVEIEPIPAGNTLAGMLADGQLEELFAAETREEYVI